jgi:serpin B
VAANSDFALDLYAALAKENPGQNLFFSPYSISSALALTAEGARGETAAEIQAGNDLPGDEEDLAVARHGAGVHRRRGI